MSNQALLGEHFGPDEFRCRCGECGLGLDAMKPRLLQRLAAARKRSEVPFVITSSIRCPAHNAAVGGVEASAHVSGWAVDIAANTGRARHEVVLSALSAGFGRIGVAESFVHIDCDPDKPDNVIWTY